MNTWFYNEKKMNVHSAYACFTSNTSGSNEITFQKWYLNMDCEIALSVPIKHF